MIAYRLTAFLTRFTIAVSNMGLLSAVRVLFLSRFKHGRTTIWIKRAKRNFLYRAGVDGVHSHFYAPGPRILDSPACPVRTIVDGGANIGDETLRLQHFHPAAEIVAVEASAANFEILSQNFAHDAGITCLHRAIWSTPAQLSVVDRGDPQAFMVSAHRDEATPSVEAITIPEIISMMRWSCIDVMKLDIEGAEGEVFSQANDWIDQVNCVIFEMNDSDVPGAALRVMHTVRPGEFDAFISGENAVLIRRSTGWRVETTPWL